ncbi:hypothetical protein [Mycobacterium sp. SP-6446]|nr:hypothetical protein [Mycobacterium sp. SP-6446]
MTSWWPAVTTFPLLIAATKAFGASAEAAGAIGCVMTNDMRSPRGSTP